MAGFQYERLQGLRDAPEAPAGQDDVADFISFGSEPAEEPAEMRTPPTADAADDQPTTSGRVETPWKAGSHKICSPLIRLHNELVDFCSFLSPTENEARIRKTALQTISDAVTSVWTEATVEPFGSFVTGLYLPTSDLDLVILSSGCTNIPSGLKALAQCLVRKSLATEIQIIAKAKVPIIKFKEVASGLNFDISFNAANGPQAAEYVRDLMQQLPPMRSLILVLKVFLHQRELNEVYQGGIGSYALLVMVAAFLLLHPSRGSTGNHGKGRPQLEGNLGVLLLDFLRLYGRSLNVNEVGVSCQDGGYYFYKRDKGFLQRERPSMLAVEDPQDPTNDLAKGSYSIQKVRSAFDFAYQQLCAPARPGEAILHRIIRLDAVLTDRQVAEPQSPSPEPELPRLPERPKLPGPPKLLEPEPVASSVVAKLTKRKRPDQASSETSSGTWRASTGKHPNGAAQEQSEDSEANDTLPEEHRPDRGRRSEHPSDGRSPEERVDSRGKHNSKRQRRKLKRDRRRSPDKRAGAGRGSGLKRKLWDSPTSSHNDAKKRPKRERERDRAFTSSGRESGEL